MTRRQLRSHIIAVCIGLTGTLTVTGAYRFGRLDWLESRTLDLRYLHTNSMPEAPNIRCIDIDDEALEIVGRWPWSRDIQSTLIDLLAELGAKSILIDLNWGDPELPFHPAPNSPETVADPLAVKFDTEDTRFPDMHLSAALRRAGNTFLAVLFQSRSEEGEISTATQSALRARVRDWLTTNERDPAKLGSWWPEIYYAFFPDKPIENQTRDKAELWTALLYILGYDATMRGNFVAPQNVRGGLRSVDEITPVHFRIARAGRGFGFVVFKEDSDGVVRRQVVLVEHEGRVLPQLALAVACDAVGAGPEDITVSNQELHINRPGIQAEPLSIQLDDEGRMMIPWVARSDWTRHFEPHIPAAMLWQVHDRRAQMADNFRNIRDITERSVFLCVADPGAYDTRLGEFKALESELSQLRLTATEDRIAEAGDLLATWRRQIESIEKATIEQIEPRLTELAALPYSQHEIEIETLKHAAAQLKETQPFERANRKLQTEIDDLLERLRPNIRDNICLIGYTATALADMTSTPINVRTPGVMAHANLINGVLTGRTVRWLSPNNNAALAILFGILITALTIWRRLWGGLAFAVLLSGLWLLIAAAMFHQSMLFIGITPVIGSIVVSYLGISAYYYAFVDRERRQLASALGQYTSKTIARQVAENPELCRRAETREVTAMFTDLKGFTSISERIGAERTQRVLNICLGEFTEVMLRYEAMVNKFIGDGIFAFWNPVIYPQPDHAMLTCETAVELMIALKALIKKQMSTGGDEVFAELVLRIGVATGNAVVGPCGSEQKWDYTCIGDSVNVAARLESANKFYGTLILISGATHDAVAERFEFRALGGVQVKGKQQAVPIYELLGRAGEVAESTLAYADEFSRAVGQFQERAFDRARAAFEKCVNRRADDLAAIEYVAACEGYLEAAPPDDWNGALALREK